jgi:DNA-binding transcriptional ArsR family regulator
MESVFEIIAEPNRRAILSPLVSSQQSVGEIERQLRIPQPTVSKHLRVLREARFVESSVDAQDGSPVVADGRGLNGAVRVRCRRWAIQGFTGRRGRSAAGRRRPGSHRYRLDRPALRLGGSATQEVGLILTQVDRAPRRAGGEGGSD